MNEIKQIFVGLSKSEYIDEWILRLKDNPVLFSPEKNIKPCERIDDQYVRSSYWDTLDLIDAYCKSGKNNPNVDAFVVELLNKSVSLFKNDKEEDPYNRLNSSNAILTKLFEICIQKKEYFDNVDVVSIVKASLQSITSWPFSIIYALHLNKHVIVSYSPDKVFEIYRTIIDFGGKAVDYDNYFNIEELIARSPYKYYEYCKSQISTFDFTISDMGAFYEYEGGYNKGKEAIVFNIFKASSKSIDSTVLEKDVKQFISSNEKLYKKIGLCLININFSKLKNLFVENIDRFLNDNEYYSDLRCLLSNNIANIKDEKTQEIIVRKIQTASFGLNNKKALEILKNYLCKLLSQSGLNAPFVEPTKADISFVMNYNKSFYVVNHDFESDIVSIKEKIKDVSVYESVDIFNKLIKGSGYFQDTVRRAFIETYFLETGSSKNVALFGYEFGIALIHYHENKKEMTLLYETISDVLNVCKEDSSFVNCMSSILFSIHSNYQKLGKEKFKSLLKMIDYKWLVIDEFKYEEEIISECINENMHTYFELLTFAVDKRVLPFAYLKEVVPFHMKMYSSSKFKAILAFVFPRIFRINKSFALSLIDFVFDNWFMNTNPSYCMLAISHGYSLELIELLSSRNDLKAYLLNQKENRDVKMAQSILFNWFLAGYFKDKKYDEILDLAFNSKRYDVIIENIRSLNYWIEERQIKNNDKELLNYFSKFFLCIDDSLKAYSERDQLIRELSSSIILTNGLIKESWLSLMKLFDYFDHFFSDESVELIKKFKDTHKDYVTQVLNKYFDSYDQLRTYEDTLRQVLGIIASDVFYKEQIKKWQVSISKKNPYFVF